ncbi:hypothetical protein [uncultured Alistipes sp.]|jgi:hypothetical protein|uniref:hypothetical protein n=1 Tax=uncultured Alistipes sp. TaxID=538949 RepID=UPI00272ADC2A|nr:hypothetical protein [uncultured Alistipes sp.]
MAFKKFVLSWFCLVSVCGACAQEFLAGVGFETRFDNREYAGNAFDRSQTLFSARLTPRAGLEWAAKNRLVFGVDLLQNFGDKSKFLTDVKPLFHYRFDTRSVRAVAGIFDRSELAGHYSRAFFSDSTRFYQNRLAGFLGRYVSTAHPGSYVELALDWEGMYSHRSREMFRILSAGRYAAERGFYAGYAFSLFHFAGRIGNKNVTDNLLLNPYAGWKFDAFFDFDIRANFLFAPQRGRSVDNSWRTPCGGQLDIVLRKWGLKLENNLYAGANLQPLRNYVSDPAAGLTYAEEGLYAGESFYATTEHIYNRTWVGYERSFFQGTLSVEAGMVFHYDGAGTGTQQVVRLKVDIDKIFRKKH